LLNETGLNASHATPPRNADIVAVAASLSQMALLASELRRLRARSAGGPIAERALPEWGGNAMEATFFEGGDMQQF